jgi:hypothetical protein
MCAFSFPIFRVNRNPSSNQMDFELNPMAPKQQHTSVILLSSLPNSLARHSLTHFINAFTSMCIGTLPHFFDLMAHSKYTRQHEKKNSVWYNAYVAHNILPIPFHLTYTTFYISDETARKKREQCHDVAEKCFMKLLYRITHSVFSHRFVATNQKWIIQEAWKYNVVLKYDERRVTSRVKRMQRNQNIFRNSSRNTNTKKLTHSSYNLPCAWTEFFYNIYLYNWKEGDFTEWHENW